MKTLLFAVFLTIAFVGCGDEAVSNKVNTSNIIHVATITDKSGLSETIEYTHIEYSMVLDNSGYGFAFTKNGVFVKSYLTENIQSIITTPKE